jgi:hypothetical protein
MINKNLCFIVSPTTATTATTAATTATHTHTLNMYLSEHELNAILQTPYYSQPFNTSFVNYTFYRGRYNANVLTVRFNVQNDMFNETFIQGILLTQTEDHYGLDTNLRVSVFYDLVLENNPVNENEERSFYIWRANSNRRAFNDESDEIFMSLNVPNLTQWVRQAVQVHLPDLNVHFANSNVFINRLLAIVFTFVKV